MTDDFSFFGNTLSLEMDNLEKVDSCLKIQQVYALLKINATNVSL